jgi:hypothetical protein
MPNDGMHSMGCRIRVVERQDEAQTNPALVVGFEVVVVIVVVSTTRR